MRNTLLATSVVAVLLYLPAEPPASADGGPYVKGRFHGRIAYSCDGNHNDPDDWIASPVTLAILAQSGLKNRLVHFDYNNILPRTHPDWEKTHAESVLGTAERYGFDKSLLFDCRKSLDRAVASIARAVNQSSAREPLYFVIAGPMEVPYLGIQKSDPAKRKFVYCISHSRWNDGFASDYRFTHTKRSVIEEGVHWVQIGDQNRLLSFGCYGRPSAPEQFKPYFWMRDSRDAKLRWLWERMLVSTRPDPSDAGMTWFLATGDEECTPVKLKRLLEDRQPAVPIAARRQVRVEAENFRYHEGFMVEDRDDRNASHRLNVRLASGTTGRICTQFDEPFTQETGDYDVEVRYLDDSRGQSRIRFLVNGDIAGAAWQPSQPGGRWATHVIAGVIIRRGDALTVEVQTGSQGGVRIDFVQLNFRPSPSPSAPPAAVSSGARRPLDDPQALPGQIIVAGPKLGYLKYNGGGPAFLSGPDNPEAFLCLGTLIDDGTRSGGAQSEIIRRMASCGVNAFHCLMFRMRRCNIKDEGDDTHSAFLGHDPSKPLNQRVLDQWEGWLSELEKAGILVDFEFYNDATDVDRMGWTLGSRGELYPDEKCWVERIVARFKRHKNILWSNEESCNKLPPSRAAHFKKIAELIARTDDHQHPIILSFAVPNDPEGVFPPTALRRTPTSAARMSASSRGSTCCLTASTSKSNTAATFNMLSTTAPTSW